VSVKAIIGGIIFLLLALLGAFGSVSVNGEAIESRPVAFLVSVTIIPLILIVCGYIFGGIKTALISFLKEVLAFFRKPVG